MIRPALVPWPAVALVDLLNRVIDGADDLAARGYLFDPDPPHEWAQDPGEAFTELAGLVAGCRLCRVGPSALGDHWLNVQGGKWERALPVWECSCGAAYKLLGELEHSPEFHLVAADGLLGDRVGWIRHDSKGKVRHSDECPGCGVQFSVTITRRQVPEGALF
jgi:hypothetical protein